MAARYSVSEAIDLLFDDDFGLSDDDLSEEESDDSMPTEVYSLSKKLWKT